MLFRPSTNKIDSKLSKQKLINNILVITLLVIYQSVFVALQNNYFCFYRKVIVFDSRLAWNIYYGMENFLISNIHNHFCGYFSQYILMFIKMPACFVDLRTYDLRWYMNNFTLYYFKFTLDLYGALKGNTFLETLYYA